MHAPLHQGVFSPCRQASSQPLTPGRRPAPPRWRARAAPVAAAVAAAVVAALAASPPAPTPEPPSTRPGNPPAREQCRDSCREQRETPIPGCLARGKAVGRTRSPAMPSASKEKQAVESRREEGRKNKTAKIVEIVYQKKNIRPHKLAFRLQPVQYFMSIRCGLNPSRGGRIYHKSHAALHRAQHPHLVG